MSGFIGCANRDIIQNGTGSCIHAYLHGRLYARKTGCMIDFKFFQMYPPERELTAQER